MPHGEFQGTITTHGKTGNGTILLLGPNPVLLLDEWDKLVDEIVFPKVLLVVTVAIPGYFPIRDDKDAGWYFTISDPIVGYPAGLSKLNPPGFVIRVSMKEVHN